MRRLVNLLRLRFGDKVTALGGLLLGVLLAGVVLSFFLQVGPDDAGRDATVVALGQTEGRTGSRPAAVVRLRSGESLTVRLQRGEACRVGDTITVHFYRTLWGRWLRSGDCRR